MSFDKLDQGDKVFKTVEDFVNTYVEDTSKRRPIRKLLVATNGIAAVRCILSIRKLLMQLFRNDRIIKFICFTTEQEIRSNAVKTTVLHSIVDVLDERNLEVK
ncbi:hypothetical protein COOONC_28020 [Cooperia oncophora]